MKSPAEAGARRPKKISGRLRQGPLVSPYELVDSEMAAFPVGALCEAVGVSRSAYYAWCKSTPSAREVANERILAEIRAIHVENEARYGSPRIVDELRERGHAVGKHRVARLMRENGI